LPMHGACSSLTSRPSRGQHPRWRYLGNLWWGCDPSDQLLPTPGLLGDTVHHDSAGQQRGQQPREHAALLGTLSHSRRNGFVHLQGDTEWRIRGKPHRRP
jgi:hypothetical protein